MAPGQVDLLLLVDAVDQSLNAVEGGSHCLIIGNFRGAEVHVAGLPPLSFDDAP